MRAVLSLAAVLLAAPAAFAQDFVVPALAGLQDSRDQEALRRKIALREADLEHIDREIRRALDHGNVDRAERLSQEFRACQEEIEDLRAQLDRPDRAPPPEKRKKPREEHGGIYLSGEVLWTNWDHKLGVGDESGVGVGLALPDSFAFRYRAWLLTLSDTGVEVLAQAYLLGFAETVDLGEKNHLVDVHLAGGLINFNADAGGPDTDSGPMAALGVDYKHYFTPRICVRFGGSFDVYWTDFNRQYTRRFWNSSLTAGLEVKF